jgi:plasmid maintenance system antidote protein VapI
MTFQSWITTWRERMTKNEFAPVTPGMMLKEEFLAEYGLSQNQLANIRPIC